VDHQHTAATQSFPQRLDDSAFRLLVENIADYAILMLDPTGVVMTWNVGAERLKGYTAGEIIGRHFSVFYPAEARERNWPATELRLAERDGHIQDEGWRVRKDGSWFWANVVITALRDQQGKLIGFGKVSRDLTERRQGEQHLRESEERLRLLVESTVDYAIFLLDTTGYIVSWNPGAQRIKGYLPEEIIGKHFSTFYPQEAVATGWPDYELREAARVGRFEDEGWRVRKDGSMFWANVVITALRAPDGTLRGFAKVTRDMTERKAHLERIESLTRELERRVDELGTINRELEQQSAENQSFVYSVSHDLRSPLVNLQGFSQELKLTSKAVRDLLSQDGVPADVRQQAAALIDGEFAESIGFIHNAVRHLSSIIDGLLRLSRVGRVDYESKDVNMNALVADILSAMHSQIIAANAKITVKPLPTVKGDRNAIGQIIANVVGNALKSFEGDNRIIEISASGDNPPVFSIRDNGVGIPLEYQSKLFQAFQHVHNSRTRGEGIGLAIVRRIVERHGGRIWFESAPGVGTTFFFTLGTWRKS
jgi:PAS domain S-box-containing protein